MATSNGTSSAPAVLRTPTSRLDEALHACVNTTGLAPQIKPYSHGYYAVLWVLRGIPVVGWMIAGLAAWFGAWQPFVWNSEKAAWYRSEGSYPYPHTTAELLETFPLAFNAILAEILRLDALTTQQHASLDATRDQQRLIREATARARAAIDAANAELDAAVAAAMTPTISAPTVAATGGKE